MNSPHPDKSPAEDIIEVLEMHNSSRSSLGVINQYVRTPEQDIPHERTVNW